MHKQTHRGSITTSRQTEILKMILGGLRAALGVTLWMKYGPLGETLWWELPETEMSISQQYAG